MRRGSARRVHFALAAWLVASWIGLGSAQADDLYYGGAGGGAFVPWSGNTGWTLMGEFGTDWSSPHVRVGGEVVFSDSSEDAWLGYPNRLEAKVGIRTYQANFVTRYMLFPGSFSPYVGVGAGFSVIDVDDQRFKQAVNPNTLYFVRGNSGVGVGGGVLGLVGLELPLGSQNVNFFAEGRASYIWELTNALEPLVGSNNFSGFSGLVGMRLRW